MKEGNAYSNLLILMKEQGYSKDSSSIMGEVTSVSPLRVDVGSFVLEEDDMFIAERLTEHKRNVSISTNVQGSTSTSSSHSHNLTNLVINNAEMTFHSPLKKGDKVILQLDNNDFYLIDKAVN